MKKTTFIMSARKVSTDLWEPYRGSTVRLQCMGATLEMDVPHVTARLMLPPLFGDGREVDPGHTPRRLYRVTIEEFVAGDGDVTGLVNE